MCSLANDDLLKVLQLILLVVVGKHVEDFLAGLGLEVTVVVEALPADSPGEVQVLLHDGDAVRVDGAEVGVFEQTGEVALSGILEGQKGRGLEAELGVNAVTDCADKSLERSLGEHELHRFLIALYLPNSDCAGSKPALLLDTTLSGSGLLLGL